MVFFSVFVCFLVFGREKKHREKLGRREISGKNVYRPCLGHAWVYLQPRARKSRHHPLQGRRRPYNGRRPQTPSNRVNLDTFRQIFIFSFQKGMELKHPMVGSQVMALRSLWCSDWYIISVFVISQLFQLEFQPMHSRWNDNWIIFAMALDSTRSGGRIKIRVFLWPTQE